MTDFPCHSIPFSEEGLENYDKIFGKDNCEEEHEDTVPGDEESGD